MITKIERLGLNTLRWIRNGRPETIYSDEHAILDHVEALMRSCNPNAVTPSIQNALSQQVGFPVTHNVPLSDEEPLIPRDMTFDPIPGITPIQNGAAALSANQHSNAQSSQMDDDILIPRDIDWGTLHDR